MKNLDVKYCLIKIHLFKIKNKKVYNNHKSENNKCILTLGLNRIQKLMKLNFIITIRNYFPIYLI